MYFILSFCGRLREENIRDHKDLNIAKVQRLFVNY